LKSEEKADLLEEILLMLLKLLDYHNGTSYDLHFETFIS